jgi:outer membrane receptor for ferrienterochelin and colicins
MITDLLLNQSNIGQTNVGIFSSGRNKKMGYTMLALYSRSRLYDVDEDDFTEIPRTKEFTLNPKLFFYPGKASTIIIGNSFSNSDRIGGDVQVIEGKAGSEHQYFEENKSTRNISTLEFSHRTGNGNHLSLKQSLAYSTGI